LVPVLAQVGDIIELDAGRSHHLLNVLRIKPGTLVMLYDGQGSEAEARVAEPKEGAALLEQTESARQPKPEPALHLLIGVPKKAAMDLAVRMATELGVSDIHPVVCKRTVAKGDHAARWSRIAAAAAQQCGRPDLPVIHPLSGLDAALQRLPAGISGRVGVPGAVAAPAVDGPAAVLVGPEGGLTDLELERASQAGFVAVGVARWVLRADTAVAAMLTATRSPN